MFSSLLSAAAALISLWLGFLVFTLCDSFSILLLCLFLHLLFLEGEFGIGTPSQDVSEKVSVQNDTASKITIGGSWCSILQELWQGVDPTERSAKSDPTFES